jgi:hypothetical protein
MPNKNDSFDPAGADIAILLGRGREDRATRSRREPIADFAPTAAHEGRHTFASLMIAAGINAKTLSNDEADPRSLDEAKAD